MKADLKRSLKEIARKKIWLWLVGMNVLNERGERLVVTGVRRDGATSDLICVREGIHLTGPSKRCSPGEVTPVFDAGTFGCMLLMVMNADGGRWPKVEDAGRGFVRIELSNGTRLRSSGLGEALVAALFELST